jgi:ankyrin repeat protein
MPRLRPDFAGWGSILLGLALALVALPAVAQRNSVTPFSSNPGGAETPTVPLGGNPFTYSGLVASAAAANKFDDVIALLSSGTAPDDSDRQGRTGLIYAAINNNAAIAQALLDHGAQIDGRDRLGYSPLHFAAEHGSTDVLRLLLVAHAKVDITDPHGITPLMLAASNNRLAAVRLLLQYHADPRGQDYTGRDALGWGASYPAVVQALKNAAP